MCRRRRGQLFRGRARVYVGGQLARRYGPGRNERIEGRKRRAGLVRRMGRVKQQGGRRGGDLGVPGVTTGATPRSLLRRRRRITGHYVNLRLLLRSRLVRPSSVFTIILRGGTSCFFFQQLLYHTLRFTRNRNSFFSLFWKQDNNNEYTQTGKKHSLLNLLKNRNSFLFFFPPSF